MIITTETGSTYTLENGFCVKTNKNGVKVSSFRLWLTKPIPEHVTKMEEIAGLPEGEPAIGQRLYVTGRDEWWVTTRVVSVEETPGGDDVQI